MSAATEIANAEADAVEAELGPDEELDPDGEQESEPEVEPEPEDEASILRRIKDVNDKVDREDERHVKRYREIFGDDFDATYKECPLCQLAGWAFPYEGQMLEDQRAAVGVVLGDAPKLEYKEAPFSQTCDMCDGLGNVLSGARTQHGELVVCRKCNGSGWIEKVPALPTPTLTAVPAPQPLPPVQVGDPNAVYDQWGRSTDHKHFGMDPRYVT